MARSYLGTRPSPPYLYLMRENNSKIRGSTYMQRRRICEYIPYTIYHISVYLVCDVLCLFQIGQKWLEFRPTVQMCCQKLPSLRASLNCDQWNLFLNFPLPSFQIAQLVEDVQRLQGTVNKLRDSGAAQVAKLEEELAAKNKAFRILEDKIGTQEDYEEIRRELR